MNNILSGERKRILVVDDEPAVTRSLQHFLQLNAKYQVKVENTSSVAVATAEQFRPDLVLMDLDMPVVDGGELAGRFRAHPALRDVPILFLSGTVTQEEVERHGGCIGGMQFLAKPFEKNELLYWLKLYTNN